MDDERTYTVDPFAAMVLNLISATGWKVLSSYETQRNGGCVDIHNPTTGERVGGLPVARILTE